MAVLPFLNPLVVDLYALSLPIGIIARVGWWRCRSFTWKWKHPVNRRAAPPGVPCVSMTYTEPNYAFGALSAHNELRKRPIQSSELTGRGGWYLYASE
jgi:hypothetical protein